MKNKIIFGFLLLFLSKTALAAGSHDGIYSCKIAIGKALITTYYAINGHEDGTTIWTIPATSPTNQIYGYGIGKIVGNTYSGTSSTTGKPFSLTMADQKITGTATFIENDVTYVGAMSCSKVW